MVFKSYEKWKRSVFPEDFKKKRHTPEELADIAIDKILGKQVSLEPEYQKLIDDNFWDLV